MELYCTSELKVVQTMPCIRMQSNEKSAHKLSAFFQKYTYSKTEKKK